MRAWSSHTEPCFQYASRRWWVSHGSIIGGAEPIRSSHISRHRSPTIAGSGGHPFQPSIDDAHWSMSEPTQPPS